MTRCCSFRLEELCLEGFGIAAVSKMSRRLSTSSGSFCGEGSLQGARGYALWTPQSAFSSFRGVRVLPCARCCCLSAAHAADVRKCSADQEDLQVLTRPLQARLQLLATSACTLQLYLKCSCCPAGREAAHIVPCEQQHGYQCSWQRHPLVWPIQGICSCQTLQGALKYMQPALDAFSRFISDLST